MESSTTAWCAIGSNNLTGGGLWTNFESCSIQSYNLSTEKSELENIYSIIDKYSDTDYFCSTRINSIDDINTLLEANYYVLSLLDESELERVKSLSRVWARNGSSTASKAYGML